MKYIDEIAPKQKRILLRVDFNVSLDKRHHIANAERIRQTLPTITFLLKNHNTVILLSHLGRPRGDNHNLTLFPIGKKLEEFLPDRPVHFVKDLVDLPQRPLSEGGLYLLENIRFFKGEETNDKSFAKDLAQYGDLYVNDGFGVSHRKEASIVGLPQLLPSFGGLLFKKELTALSPLLDKPKSPYIAILGGSKVSTKIHVLEKLITKADCLLLGGGLANTFLKALKMPIGKSLYERTEVSHARTLVHLAEKHHTKLLLPSDVLVGDPEGRHVTLKPVELVKSHDRIFDIGPQTQAIFGQAILGAKTIVWNGPIGLFEVAAYKRGTDFIYYAIAESKQAISVVGGGETLAALSNKDHLEVITHISTGGGAMLEYLEKGTLPGIEALESAHH